VVSWESLGAGRDFEMGGGRKLAAHRCDSEVVIIKSRSNYRFHMRAGVIS